MRSEWWSIGLGIVLIRSACAQFVGGGITFEDVKASQAQMEQQMRQMNAMYQAQANQFMNQMNNQPGVQELLAANACVTTNPQRAFKLYKKSASLGWAAAYYQLARCYYNGIGTESNAKLGARWLIKAAKSGDERAQMDLARAYKTGNGVEQSDELAAQWAQRSQQTSAGKQMLMGMIMNDNNNMSIPSTTSATRDQILRSKIERAQRSLQNTEFRLDHAARTGGSTSALSATVEAQKRLIQSYQSQLSQ